MDGHDPAVTDDDPRARLRRAVEHAAHLLPAQGPIGVFIHHNTLHAFEHLRFEDAVVEAGRRLHAQPFMPEAWYRAALERGRITLEDVDAVLEQEHEASGASDETTSFDGRIGLHELRRRVLVQGLLETDDASIQWLLEEQDRGRRFLETTSLPARLAITSETTRWLGTALSSAPLGSLFADPVRGVEPYDLVRRWLGVEPRRHGIERALRDDPEACAVASLWTAAAARVHEELPYPPPEQPHPVARRWRDVLLAASDRDTNDLVHAVLIPAVAAFVDQGVAYWPMADREQGFFAAFRQLVLQGPPVPDPLLREARRALTAAADAEDVLLRTLDAMGVPPEGFDDALEAAALALPGWAGMMHRLEREPDLAPQVCPPCRLLDFLAVRLLLDRLAAELVARQAFGHRGSLAELRGSPRLRPPPIDPRLRASFALFQLAQLAGVGAPTLRALPVAALQAVRTELERFDDVTRRRLWHLAYERRHRLDVLGALARHRRTLDPARERLSPSLQILFCIDDRSESIRRHVEEHDPSIETFGTAGFFGLAIAFRGLDDAHQAALCPVVQRPLHEVVEQSEEDELSPLYRVRRRLFAALAQGTFRGSRNLFRGAIATLGLGLLSLVPLTLRVLAPRGVTRLYARLQTWFFPRPRTRLAIRRAAEERGDIEMFPGFTVTEMADRVSRVLQDMGLVRSFAPLVAAVGHGSSSLNNPHESAYDCGACGGRRGGPNARLFAMMANDPKVRAELAARGLSIPRSTVFVGGYHDTCTDAVTWFDFEELPADASASLAGLRAAEMPAHASASLARLRAAVEHARTRNAHERCRRFESAPLDAEPEVALRHVEGRAADLAEPRSECGHATNAICVFGRRGLTRGLFLDRRALLVSYDPTLDPEGEVLGRLLAAMGPVAAGINLEYLFSYVDNERYGCGTKLPHNLTGLIGVMNGHESDLRTGLPRQMVEIHEPVRLLVVCETTLELMQRALANHPAVGRLFTNRWVQLALMDPHTGQLGVVEDGRLVPLPEPSDPLPTAARSEQWYRQRRDHLPIAAVTAPTRAQA